MRLAPTPSPDPVVRSPADQDRLARMFEAHHETVWRTLRRRGLSPDVAADVAQETFLIAAERLADIHPLAERAFLLATAFRVIHTLGRKTARWYLDDAMHLYRGHTRDTSDARADIQLCDLVLSRIAPELAEVFALYEAEGLSSQEIATLLGIPRGSVASRLRRAREQFRAVVLELKDNMQREGNS